MSSIPRFDHYDVVIVGAGMVGSTLACALSRPGVVQQGRLLLVEASSIDVQQAAQQPGYDMRSTVLSAGTAACFAHLGLWQDCAATAEPIVEIHVSDQGRIGSVRLNSQEERVTALGYVVENAALGRSLNRSLLERDLELCAPASVQLLQPSERGMRLTLSTAAGEQTLTASLVVLADGGRSGLCRQVGIDHQEHRYGQAAIIANVSFSKAHQGVAYERFTSKGPLALLPLPDHEREHCAALVWTHPESEADAVIALPDAQFLAALQEDFGARLGRFTRVGKRMAYPLSLQLAGEQVRPGLVLLGNAAHSLHPVAGQGFNLALRDTMLLAENILQSLEAGCAPGSATRLHAYLEAASLDQTLTIRFSDYMTRLFSTNKRPLAWARQWGMACVDMLPPLKHSLSRQAMGMAQPRVLP